MENIKDRHKPTLNNLHELDAQAILCYFKETTLDNQKMLNKGLQLR